MMKCHESLSTTGVGVGCRARALKPRLAAVFLILLTCAMLLNGCTGPGFILGAGASTALAASEERGVGGALRDSRIKAEMNFNLLEEDRILFKGVSTSIYEGRVLLTGVAKTIEKRDAAVRIAWETPGVKEVINAVIVDPSGSSGSFAGDTWISTKLRSKLLFDRDISAINYSIDTLRGTVHLLGVAQDRGELEKVLDHARHLSHVKNVVNHVILKTDPRRQSDQAMND